MSRYLSPSKVALLALAVIYSEGVVPTVSTTAVLSFLISHVLPDASHPLEISDVDSGHAVSMVAFEHALSTQGAVIPGRNIWDLFLKKLWSLNCADALDLFLTNTPSLLTKTREQQMRERETSENEPGHGRVSRTSPLGAFIRRSYLEYTRLQFEDTIKLWQSFLVYRLPTRQAWEKKNAPDPRSGLDVNLSDLSLDSSHPVAQIMYGRSINVDEENGGLSTFDMERLMEFQVSELQSMYRFLRPPTCSVLMEYLGLGGRLPEEMRTKLGHISKSGAKLPSLAHYLRLGVSPA